MIHINVDMCLASEFGRELLRRFVPRRVDVLSARREVAYA